MPGWEQEKKLGESAIIRKLFGEVWNFIRTHRYCLLALYFIVYIVTFFIIEEHTPTEGYWVTDTFIDDYIPFVPEFAVFYIIWYPLFAAVGIPTMIKDEGAFRRWMYYNMFTLSATLILDVIIPNGQHLRPQGVEATSFGTWIMTIIWAADTPTNVFPSMHVLGCLGDILCAFDSKIFTKPWRAVITVACVLCMASTVLVKQHAFIDTVGALIFAVPAFLLFYRKRVLTKKKKQPREA